MSFRVADYERICDIARDLKSRVLGDEVDAMAKELFDMAESVIGQQSPFDPRNDPRLTPDQQERFNKGLSV